MVRGYTLRPMKLRWTAAATITVLVALMFWLFRRAEPDATTEKTPAVATASAEVDREQPPPLPRESLADRMARVFQPGETPFAAAGLDSGRDVDERKALEEQGALTRDAATGEGTDALEEVVVRGSVLDREGRSIPGAQVEILRFPIEGGNGARTSARLDDRGRFEHHAPAGDFRLKATAPGYLAAEEARVVKGKQTWEAALSLAAAAVVSGRVEDVGGQPVNEASVWMRAEHTAFHEITRSKKDGAFSQEVPPGEIELTVRAAGFLTLTSHAVAPQTGVRLVVRKGATVEGRVIDELSAPVASVSVSISSADHRESGGAVTGKDGTFKVEGLPEGRLEVVATEYARYSLGAVMKPPAASRAAKATIEVTTSVGPFVELRLAGVKGIRGRVVNEQGTAVEGIVVNAIAGSPPQQTGQLPLQMLMMLQAMRMMGETRAYGPHAISGPDGAFTLDGIAMPHYLVAQGKGLREDPSAPVVVLPDSEAVVLVLRPPRFLTADVSSSAGLPISTVLIDGMPFPAPGGHLSMEIRYAYSAPASVGAQGHLPVMKTLALSPRSDLALGTIALTAGRQIVARVTDLLTHEPLKSWWRVSEGVLPSEERDKEWVVTVPTGAASVQVSAADHLETTLQLMEDQKEVSVALDPGGTVVGTATDFAGRPVSPFGYSVRVDGCPNRTWGTIANDGTFKVHAVGPGNCTVRIDRQGDGAGGTAKAVVVPIHGSVTVNLVAPR